MMLGLDASSNILVDRMMDAWEGASMATHYSYIDLYLFIDPILRCDQDDVEIRNGYCELLAPLSLDTDDRHARASSVSRKDVPERFQ
jgi:hypothetical protein